jgi:prevent-host-death family protein
MYMSSAPELPPLPYAVQRMTTSEVRESLAEVVNQAAYGHVTTIITRDGRPLARIVAEEDAWFWTPEWQAKEREADEELAAGQTRTYDSMEDLFADIDEQRDEA